MIWIERAKLCQDEAEHRIAHFVHYNSVYEILTKHNPKALRLLERADKLLGRVYGILYDGKNYIELCSIIDTWHDELNKEQE